MREGNQCADFMAKIGANQYESWKIFSTPPQGLSSLLLADMAGIEFISVVLSLYFAFVPFLLQKNIYIYNHLKK